MVILGIAAYLATTEPLQWVSFLAIAVVVVLVSLVQWPYGALLVLMIAAAMPRWFMRIDSLNAKPEHLIALLCALLLLARIFSGKRLSTSLQRIDFLLLGFLVINVFSSIVASPQPAATLRWATLLILATLPFFLVQQLAVTERQLQCAVSLWLFAGALEALFGIACFLSYLIFGTTSGVTFFFHLDFIPGVHGSQWEPNIFGSFCACFAVMFLYYFMAGGRNNAWHLLGFLLTSIGVLLSLARQAWVCLTLIGILVVLYNLRRPRLPWRRLLPIGIGILAAIIIGTSLMKDLPERLATLTVSQATEDPTIVNRMSKLALAVGDIMEHPFIGLGSSSYQLLYVAEDDKGITSAWLDNLFVKILHDTGAVGLVLFIWFAFELGDRACRALRSPQHRLTTTAVGALSAGVLVMLIAYELTDASTLAFTWIQIGLLAAVLRMHNTVSASVSLSTS